MLLEVLGESLPLPGSWIPDHGSRLVSPIPTKQNETVETRNAQKQ
jgi:hypothetical protein